LRAAIGELQRSFLAPAEIASSQAIMGLDTQLVEDGTYFVRRGGRPPRRLWRLEPSRHYGGEHAPGRDPAPLDPARDAALVRATLGRSSPGAASAG
jgi:hypothetical protein